jgi:hypothetical protein
MTKRVSLRKAAMEEAHDERRLVPYAGEHVRLVMVDGDDREVPLEPRKDTSQRLREIAVVFLLEEMDYDLGVGLGGERVAARGELLSELDVVLDDPVEDDRQPPRLAAGQRMGIHLRHGAVRRPARVTEPVVRVGAVGAGRLDEVAEIADGPHILELLVLAQRDPGGVVAAVLEAP